uniref:Uncharacterized protein n=1 Tax=Physcomitrium patens TaxID=3218 RepID=A0A2K1K8R1_PHYPA|nr:hypothetical protein PHYPA_012059 [Physcomitrium patens]
MPCLSPPQAVAVTPCARHMRAPGSKRNAPQCSSFLASPSVVRGIGVERCHAAPLPLHTMVPSADSLLLCLPRSSTACNRQNSRLYLLCNHSCRGRFPQSKTNALQRPFPSASNWHGIKPCRTSFLLRPLQSLIARGACVHHDPR